MSVKTVDEQKCLQLVSQWNEGGNSSKRWWQTVPCTRFLMTFMSQVPSELRHVYDQKLQTIVLRSRNCCCYVRFDICTYRNQPCGTLGQQLSLFFLVFAFCICCLNVRVMSSLVSQISSFRFHDLTAIRLSSKNIQSCLHVREKYNVTTKSETENFSVKVR